MTNGELPYTTPDRLLRDFASRGLVALAPESLGIPPEIHEAIYEKEREAFNAGRYITASAGARRHRRNLPRTATRPDVAGGGWW